MSEKSPGLISNLVQLWRERRKNSEQHLSRDLQAFMPPALEVLDTPPNPLPRTLVWIIVCIFLVGVTWAVLGKVDIITTAEGKIIPGGRIRVIQPLEKGVIKQINVTEGQLVKFGQPLVELDQTQILADEHRIANDLDYVNRRIARKEVLNSFIEKYPEERLTLATLRSDPRLADIQGEIALLFEEWQGYIADSETIISQLNERRAELKTCQVMIRQYSSTLPLAENRAASIKYLYERNIVTKLDFLAVEEERLRQFHSLEAEKAREEQLQAAITSMERQLDAQEAKNISAVSTEMDELRRQQRSLLYELTKLKDMNAKQILYSPVDGTVKNLAVHTIGGVVNEAEILMEIVPMGERLEVEAFIGNQDIGYVHEGQTAEVKIHTFPLTKYGFIEAYVDSVARDATMDEKMGLIYKVKLTLAKSSLLVEEKDTPLIPGMAVSAEISTGQRRLIEFFLSPLLRMRQESLRER